MKLVVVGQMAAALKGIVDHSFQGVEQGYKSIAEFRRINLAGDYGMAFGNLSPKGYKNTSVASVIVSNGSLPSSGLSWENTEDSNIFDTVLSLPTTKPDLSTAEGIQSVLTANNWNYPTQVTVLFQIPSTIEATEWKDGYYTYPTKFMVARYIFDPNNIEKSNNISVADVSGGYALSISKGTDYQIKWNNNRFEIGANADGVGVPVCAAAVIISQTIDNVKMRSRESLVPSTAAFRALKDINLDQTPFRLGSNYGVSKDSYLSASTKSNKYLNNGTDTVYSIEEI